MATKTRRAMGLGSLDLEQDPALLSATELLDLYRARTLSPVEVTRACLHRIARLNPRLNAFRMVDEEGAMLAAHASEERWSRGEPLGKLDGIPATVKDLLLTRGWSTLRGSKAVDPNQPWDEDAPSVARLREAGAVLLGKTTTPEFGWKGVTDSPLTGITRNPWNPAMTPGGSSGGAAVAAACGMGALHLGTDGGGSIRIPAGFTGIFGFKQSFGRVPAYPPSPFGTLAHVGPMTRTVADAALMLSVISRHDARDWYALPDNGRGYLEDLEVGVHRRRIAFSPSLGGHSVDPEVADLVRQAVDVFREIGAVVEEVDPPMGHDLRHVFMLHWYAGAANALSSYGPQKRAMMDPGLIEVATEGAEIKLLDYLDAVREREHLGVRMNLFHRSWDLLLTPTLPHAAFGAGIETPDPGEGARWTDWTPFSYPFNLTRQPAATVPCGFTSSGLPVGLQIVGPSYGDQLVLAAARAYEKRQPFKMPRS
jgi:aspartyl-tRNA(Asn)/glutamyl-tRNA(Gln) amidotransferase subunit A